MKNRLFVALGVVICLVIGFFAGQEYTKYQMRKALTEAFSSFGDVLNDETDKPGNNTVKDETSNSTIKDESSNNTIKDKEKKEKEPEIDTSITISKGTTESVSSMYSSREVEAEITLNDVSFIDEIRPPEPTQSYYTYYPAQDGKTYAVINLKLKNIGGSSFDISDVLRNTFSFDSKCSAKAVFGGKYSYTADLVANLKKDNKGAYSYESTLIYIDPLETMDIIVAFSVPNEVKDKDAKLNICLGDQKINVDFTTENNDEFVEEITES